MNLLAMRMEEQYARPLNRLMRQFSITSTFESHPEQVASLARLYWTDLLLFGYTESRINHQGTFELLACFDAEPLLAALPVAIAIGRDKGKAFDEELGRNPQWWRRVLPIDVSDFASPYLDTFVRGHALRFTAKVVAVRDEAEHADTTGLEFDFPWA